MKAYGMKVRMALVMSAGFVILAAVSAGFAFRYFEDAFRRSFLQNLRLISSSLADSIDARLDTAETALSAAAVGIPPAALGDVEQAQRFLAERVTLRSLFPHEIMLVSPQGRLLAEYPFRPGRRGTTIRDADLVRRVAAQNRGVLSTLASPRDPDTLEMHLAVPVAGGDGKPAAVLLGGSRIVGRSEVDRIVKTKIGPFGRVSVLDRGGRYIIGRNGSPEDKIAPEAAPLLREAAGKGESAGEMTVAGARQFVSLHSLSRTDWIIAVKYPASEALAPLERAKAYLLETLLAGTLLFVSLAWFLTGRLTKPLSRITEHAKSLPQLPLEKKLLRMDRYDEIGTLADALNGMVLELERQKESLRESENNFRTMAQASNDGIMVFTGDGTIVYANHRGAEITGFAPSRLIGARLDDIVTPEFLPPAQERLRRTLAGEKLPNAETVFLRRDGTSTSIEISSSLTFWKGEAADLVMVRDVTDRKKGEEKLRRSERHLMEAQRVARIGSWEYDIASGRITWSRELFRLMERDPEQPEPTYAELVEMLHPDDRPLLLSSVEHAVRDAIPYRFEYRVTRPSGAIRYVTATGEPVLDGEGKPSGLFGTVMDITDRKIFEERLRESEIRFRSVFEAASDAVLVADIRTGVIVEANPQAEKLFERPLAELVGMHQSQLHPPEAAEFYRDLFANRDCDRAPVSLQILTGSGERVEVEVSDSNVEISGRTYRLGLFRDIRERKRAEEEIVALNRQLAARAEELAAMNRDLESFSYSLTHDLRNPLAAISLAAQMLVENWTTDPEQVAIFLERIEISATRMEEMINAMLAMARISSAEIGAEEISLSDLAQEIMLGLQIAEPERRVCWHCTPGLVVRGDPNLLASVLENLLGNAWKYTGRREEAVIEFGACCREGKSAFFVRDNGVGLDMSKAGTIFQPFRRLHGDFEGTGIGLATVQRIVTRHGGEVWAEGEPDKGATFYFSLCRSTVGGEESGKPAA